VGADDEDPAARRKSDATAVGRPGRLVAADESAQSGAVGAHDEHRRLAVLLSIEREPPPVR